MDALLCRCICLNQHRVKQSGVNAAWGVGETALDREPVHSLRGCVHTKPQEPQPPWRQRTEGREQSGRGNAPPAAGPSLMSRSTASTRWGGLLQMPHPSWGRDQSDSLTLSPAPSPTPGPSPSAPAQVGHTCSLPQPVSPAKKFTNRVTPAPGTSSAPTKVRELHQFLTTPPLRKIREKRKGKNCKVLFAFILFPRNLTQTLHSVLKARGSRGGGWRWSLILIQNRLGPCSRP